MGEGTHGMKQTPEQIEQEVHEIRDRMEPNLAELDRRRHHFAAWTRRMKHRLPRVLGAVVVLVGVVRVVQAVAKRNNGHYRPIDPQFD